MRISVPKWTKGLVKRDRICRIEDLRRWKKPVEKIIPDLMKNFIRSSSNCMQRRKRAAHGAYSRSKR
jgi:hypothetical protein